MLVRVLVGRLVGRCPICRWLLALALALADEWESSDYSNVLGAGLLADLGGRT